MGKFLLKGGHLEAENCFKDSSPLFFEVGNPAKEHLPRAGRVESYMTAPSWIWAFNSGHYTSWPDEAAIPRTLKWSCPNLKNEQS